MGASGNMQFIIPIMIIGARFAFYSIRVNKYRLYVSLIAAYILLVIINGYVARKIELNSDIIFGLNYGSVLTTVLMIIFLFTKFKDKISKEKIGEQIEIEQMTVKANQLKFFGNMLMLFPSVLFLLFRTWSLEHLVHNDTTSAVYMIVTYLIAGAICIFESKLTIGYMKKLKANISA